MPETNLSLGKKGEDIALGFLKKNGYSIIQRNYRTKLGEIDIIAKDKDTLCFIEVKSRSSCGHGLPQESVFKLKQGQISKAALAYLKEKNLLDKRARFDVVSVLYADGETRIEIIKNAFELDERYTI
ncbi:MAG: YraN family protein [Candidatus Omnitrophota bacterium]|nr:YraN family protein [Candidatus Omnitrophota bacterium]